MNRFIRADGTWAVLVLVLWLGLQIGLILRAGESLSGDAWAYAKSAQIFHQTARLVIPDRSPQSLIFLTLWSGFFTKLFGFSFITLKGAVLTLNALGSIFFLLLLREMCADRSAVLPLAVYLFNPLFFPLAGGYLTDAPFLSLLVIGLYFFIRAHREWSERWACVGSAVSACAFLVRQYALLLPLAAAVPLLARRAAVSRPTRGVMLGATLLPAMTTAGFFFFWLNSRHGTPSEFHVYALELLNLPRIAWATLAIPFFASLYLGLFLSPLLGGKTFGREGRGLFVGFMLLVTGVVVILALRDHPLPFGWQNRMPYLSNTFNPPAGSGFWLIMTAWSIVGAAALWTVVMMTLIEMLRSRVRQWEELQRARFLGLLRRSLCGLGVLGGLLLSGLFRRPLIEVGQWIVAQIYHRWGGASGRHTFPLSYWIERVPILYDQLRDALLLMLLMTSGGLLCAYRKITTARGEPTTRHESLPRLRHTTKSNDVSPAGRSRDERFSQGAFPSRSDPTWMTVIVFLLMSLAFLIIFYTDKDRYLLVLIPPSIVVLQARKPGSSVAGAWLLTLVLAVIAVGNTFVGVEVSRKMWEGGRYLLSQGISPARIRADISFNAWHLYDLRGTRKADDPLEWWVIGQDYVVDIKPWSGYEVLKTFPYGNCFTLSRETVYVMKRMSIAADERK